MRGKCSIKKVDRENYNNTWTLPIICICNNNFDKKIAELKKDCLDIQLDNINNLDLLKFVINVCKNEKLSVPLELQKDIVNFVGSDVRKILHILEDIKNIYKSKEITQRTI